MKNLYIDFEKEFTTVKLTDIATTEYYEIVIPISYEDLGSFYHDITECIGEVANTAYHDNNCTVDSNLPELVALLAHNWKTN